MLRNIKSTIYIFFEESMSSILRRALDLLLFRITGSPVMLMNNGTVKESDLATNFTNARSPKGWGADSAATSMKSHYSAHETDPEPGHPWCFQRYNPRMESGWKRRACASPEARGMILELNNSTVEWQHNTPPFLCPGYPQIAERWLA